MLRHINKKPKSIPLSRRKKIFAKLKEKYEKKKEWVKLNTSYIAGTTTATVSAYTASYIAEKAGVDRTSATTWIAGFSAYVGGVTAVCVSWWLLHKDIYRGNPKRLFKDMVKMVANTFLAQTLTWGVSWTGTVISVMLGASNVLAVTVQQILDRIVFIPTFNYLNRKRVKEMEQDKNL